MKATKNICAKGESAVDHSTVGRLLKKLWLGCKNLHNQAKSGGPKSVDSKAVLQAIAVNPVSRERQMRLALHSPLWFVTFMVSTKSI